MTSRYASRTVFLIGACRPRTIALAVCGRRGRLAAVRQLPRAAVRGPPEVADLICTHYAKEKLPARYYCSEVGVPGGSLA